MKKKIIIFLIIIALLIGGGIVVWKLNQSKENKSSDNSPTKLSLSQLSDKELEKCLLEDFSRRLDLEKYFVFNLGKEVKTEGQAKTTNSNWRAVSENLSSHLTNLATFYEKKLDEKEGYKLIGGTGKNRTLGRLRKEMICFLGENFKNFNKEFNGDNLDEKIKNGQNCYIIFEKSDEFPITYFQEQVGRIDENGKQELAWDKLIRLRTKCSATNICENKTKALEFLKNNDPALTGKN